jgi:hypothetical protein
MFIARILYFWQTRKSLIMPSLKFQDTTHHMTGHSPCETVPFWTTGMVHCSIECTEKTEPYNITCLTVIMGNKQWNTIRSYNKE